MKTIVSPNYVCAVLTVAMFTLSPPHARAQETPPAPAKEAAKTAVNVTGVWRSTEAGNGRSAWKFIQDGFWSMTEQTANGQVTIHHGGTFTLEGDVYSESVLWAGDVTRSMIGKTNRFQVTIEGDTCKIKGLNNSFGGTWTRVKPGEKIPDKPAAPADPVAKRKADIDFFLTEFKKQAAHLIKTKQIDWDQVTAWCRAEEAKVQTDEDHLRLCQRLLARLRDGHARLEGCRVTFPDDSNGRRSIGAPVQLILTKDAAVVSGATEEAAAAGAAPGVIVTKIDGRPAREWLDAKVDEWLDKYCYSTRHHALFTAAKYGLGGWEGTTLRLTLKTGEAEKEIELKRQGAQNVKAFTAAKQLPGLKRLGRHTYGKTAGGNGYIHLGNTPGDLPEQLDKMLADIGDVPGMILDMRGNSGGGCDHAAVFGEFLKKGKRWGSYQSRGEHPFAGPMIVILDAGCASAGETVGGQFGEDQRACMIGDTPTAGMSSSKTRVPAPSGLFTAYFSVYSNKARFNRGRGIEGVGVQPHEFVPWEPADLAAGIDTQIRRAEEILKNGIPKNLIDYVPPTDDAPAKEEK